MSPGPDPTRAERYEALLSATVAYDLGNYQRTARWPRLLHLPTVAAATLPDGGLHWRHEYRTVGNDAGEEQLVLQRDSTVVFQRDTLWDVDDMGLEFGLLAEDAVMFLAFAAKFSSAVRAGSDVTVALRVRTSQTVPGTLALFSGRSVAPEQRDRSARLRRPRVDGSITLAPATTPGPLLVAAAKRLLDRIANEFDLDAPLDPSPRPSFLAIDAASIAALVGRFTPRD